MTGLIKSLDNICNLTPHDINVLADDGMTILTIPASGLVTRMESEDQKQMQAYDSCGDLVDQTILGVPLYEAQKFTKCVLPAGIPSKTECIVVSMPVGEFYRTTGWHRKYMIVGPDTGPDGAVRNEKGQIVGTRRLVLYSSAAADYGRSPAPDEPKAKRSKSPVPACKLCAFIASPRTAAFGQQRFPVMHIHIDNPLVCPTCAYKELDWKRCRTTIGYLHATCKGCAQACETTERHPAYAPLETPVDFFE